MVLSGAVSDAPTVVDGAEVVSAGGTVSGAVVSGSASILVGASGTALATTVDAGQLTVLSGGAASGLVVAAAGRTFARQRRGQRGGRCILHQR